MKNIFFLLSFLFLGFLGQAQNESIDNITEAQEITEPIPVKVVLKGGSVIFGQLISYEPEVGILVRYNGSDVFIKEDTYKKFVTFASTKQRNYSRLATKKMYFRTNIGLLSNTNGTGSTMNISALYQFNSYFSAGLGVGIDNYYFNEPHNIFPVFAEFKTNLVDKNSSPYVSLKTGYSFNRPHKDSGQVVARGGLLINPTFGYRFGSNGIMFDLYAGYRFQQAYYEKLTSWSFSAQDILWKRVELGMALSF